MPHRSLRVRTRTLVRRFTVPPMPQVGEPRTPAVATGVAGRRLGRRERAAS